MKVSREKKSWGGERKNNCKVTSFNRIPIWQLNGGVVVSLFDDKNQQKKKKKILYSRTLHNLLLLYTN